MSFPGQPLPAAWSYSKLKNFETCAKRHFHYDLQRDVKEPESEQLRAGHELHAHFEARLKGTPLPFGYTHYEKLLAKIVEAPGKTYGEQKLALTSSFQPVGYFGKGVWFRTVIDCAKITDTYAMIFDWKTGKPSDDMTQLQLCAATVFHHMTKIERIRAALVFVNHDHIEWAEFVRGDVTEIWGEILPRVKRMEKARQDMEFPPKPSGLCKRYCAVLNCPYHGKGG